MSKLKIIDGMDAYVSTSGKETLLKDMTYPHLENAIKKLEKENHDEAELKILRDELASRPVVN